MYNTPYTYTLPFETYEDIKLSLTPSPPPFIRGPIACAEKGGTKPLVGGGGTPRRDAAGHPRKIEFRP